MEESKLHVIKYLSHFVTRAFLIAIMCIMGVFCFVVMLYFGDLLLSYKDGKSKSPLFGAYVIVSPSMVPTIKINDAIIIKRVDNDKYNIGDIITFSSSDINYQGRTITHRIVDKDNFSNDESVYTTKGDNNPVVDPSLVRTSSIYGKVMFKIPGVGYFQSFMSKPSNFFLSLLIPVIIFIVYDLSRIYIMMRRRLN